MADQRRRYSVATPAAGVAPGTVLTATPPLTLYNPLGSSVALELIGASMGYVSGTLGKGTLVLGANPSTTQAAPTGGTLLAQVGTYFGYTGSVALCYQGATLAAVPTLVEPLFITGAFVGAADTALQLERRWENLRKVLAPGTSISLQGIMAAGAAPLVILALWWEETPI